VLELIRIFDGSFGGSTLFENEAYTTPNALRAAAKAKMASKYKKRIEAKERKAGVEMPTDELAGIFA
jgi:ribosome biogenesis protein BRX1